MNLLGRDHLDIMRECMSVCVCVSFRRTGDESSTTQLYHNTSVLYLLLNKDLNEGAKTHQLCRSCHPPLQLLSPSHHLSDSLPVKWHSLYVWQFEDNCLRKESTKRTKSWNCSQKQLFLVGFFQNKKSLFPSLDLPLAWPPEGNGLQRSKHESRSGYGNLEHFCFRFREFSIWRKSTKHTCVCAKSSYQIQEKEKHKWSRYMSTWDCHDSLWIHHYDNLK